jgi:protein-S-isoprenylcysteine O-methyltransferase Ste14
MWTWIQSLKWLRPIGLAFAAAHSTSQYIPLAFSLVFIGVLFWYRVIRFTRIHGRSPIHAPRSGDYSAHAFLSRWLMVFFVMTIVLASLGAFWPVGLESIDPLYQHRRTNFMGPGILLGVIASLLVWRGQADMDASWRIGIDGSERTQLVTRGLFRFCRNPIYLGLQVGLVSFVLLQPGYLTIILLFQGLMLLHVQTRLEEEYLLRCHQDSYLEYCAAVGRFIPLLGRWRKTTQRTGVR